MRHVLFWHRLAPADQTAATAAEAALRAAPTAAAHAAAAARLVQIPGVLVATAADLRVVRSAMGWIGMGASTPATAARAYALPPTDATGWYPGWSAAGQQTDDLAADARQRAAVYRRLTTTTGTSAGTSEGTSADTNATDATDGTAAGSDDRRPRGIPLRTLTIPGLTWDVAAEDCRHALRVWRGVLRDWHPDQHAVFDVCGLTTERRRRIWLTWLAFLTGAARHGGFHAEGATHPINRTTFTGREDRAGGPG